MKARKTKRRIKTRGKAPNWSDAEIEARSVVSDDEKMDAVEFFEARTSKGRKKILRAR